VPATRASNGSIGVGGSITSPRSSVGEFLFDIQAVDGSIPSVDIERQFGRLAQSGERLFYKQEVEGSIPSSSTT
jgi:hypothetical protein